MDIKSRDANASSQDKWSYLICKIAAIVICAWSKAKLDIKHPWNPSVESHSQRRAQGPGNHGQRSWGSLAFSVLGLGYRRGWGGRGVGCIRLLQIFSDGFKSWIHTAGQGQRDKIGDCPKMWQSGQRVTEIILMDVLPHSSTMFPAFSLSLIGPESFHSPGANCSQPKLAFCGSV